MSKRNGKAMKVAYTFGPKQGPAPVLTEEEAKVVKRAVGIA